MPAPGLRRAASAATALLLIACGGDDDAAATSTTSATSATTTSTTSATTADDTTADDTTTTTTTAAGEDAIEITIASGSVVGGVERARVSSGDEVTLRITSDAPDEVHVHGYEIEEPLTAGEATDITFVADLPGVWEVELHDAGIPILELEVS